jgi:hypothetical protein
VLLVVIRCAFAKSHIACSFAPLETSQLLSKLEEVIVKEGYHFGCFVVTLNHPISLISQCKRQ